MCVCVCVCVCVCMYRENHYVLKSIRLHSCEKVGVANLLYIYNDTLPYLTSV